MEDKNQNNGIRRPHSPIDSGQVATGAPGQNPSLVSETNNPPHNLKSDRQSQLKGSNQDQDAPKRHDGSNRNYVNDKTIVKADSIGFNTKSLRQYLKTDNEMRLQNSSKDHDSNSPLALAEKSGSKIYKLVGYTTVGKINRTFEKEHRQIVLRKFLVTAIIVLVLLIGFIILNPFKSTSDIKRILGIDSKFNNEAYESFKDKEADQTINLPSQTHIKDHD